MKNNSTDLFRQKNRSANCLFPFPLAKYPGEQSQHKVCGQRDQDRPGGYHKHVDGLPEYAAEYVDHLHSDIFEKRGVAVNEIVVVRVDELRKRTYQQTVSAVRYHDKRNVLFCIELRLPLEHEQKKSKYANAVEQDGVQFKETAASLEAQLANL